jgi:type VI secretion system secreted protein VgrG
MASQVIQENRSLALTTPLGADVLKLVSFSGTEAISQLFTYQFEMTSEDDSIAPKDIVGKNVTWSVSQFDKGPRFFNGFVSRFSAGARDRRKLRTYHAEVVPWLWFLTRTANCRIFQNMGADAIIAKVIGDCGFSPMFESKLSAQYAVREYCVQYRETAFNFISRLAEFEGMFYYFRHEEGKHTLVLGDKATAYVDCAEGRVSYSSGSLAANHVGDWNHGYEFTSGKWTRTDYNFQAPSNNLTTTAATVVDTPDSPKFEVFDYPGDYMTTGDGTPVTKVRMEEIETGYDVATGAGQCCTFTPGGKFALEDHDVESENDGYVITSVHHYGSEESYDTAAERFEYGNTFSCIKDSVVFRPRRTTRRPFVQGVQTAVVTGPAGEEIYVDKYGRVKVQFFWDREGKKDEKSSCWIRVSEQWAGKNWGFVAHPRIGQEVIVDFLEGDPDRPLITGRIYNAEQMPPYDLPANMTQSGIKSRSSKGAGTANFNEISFEDKKGSELLNIHAEKDQSISVEHDESHTVGHDRTKTIDNDETTHVKHDRTETVDNNETITIHGKRTEVVDKDENITIHQNRTEVVDKDENITISGNRTETVQKDESITINGGRTETVAKDESITINGGRTETVAKNESITINGGRTETVAKDESITINGGRTESVAKDESVSVTGGRTVSIGKADTLTVGKALMITAADSITLTTGSASITMKKDGTITINGKDITTDASGEIVGKAGKNMTLKGQKILQN